MSAPSRKIIHIDMDAFFAAVEQRDQPELKNKPIIVGGQPNSRGVVATCNYEARQFGIHSAMPSSQAHRLCPQAIFIKPRFAAYKEASQQIREIFSQYTDLYEPLSLDEAFLDVSNNQLQQGSATLIAKEIKQSILQQTQLIASAGISYNKFLAKIASDMDKPNGLYLIKPEQGSHFVETLAIGQFHGIGRVTKQKMLALDIRTGADLKKQPLALLLKTFGKVGQHYYNISRGIDNRPVNNNRKSKSVGVEKTFQVDIEGHKQVLQNLKILLTSALKKLQEKQLTATTLTIKIKYHDFVNISRSRTLSQPLSNTTNSELIFKDLLKNTEIGQRKVRLLGISLSSLQKQTKIPHYRQMDLFD